MFELDTTAPAGQLEKLLKLTERYCMVAQTLKTPVSVQFQVKR
jgi:hypothetical protein